MIPEMKFAYLSWEAVAALMTGAAAVGAAVFVGLRQQVIMLGQLEIEASKMRIDLFDKRMRIVELHSRLLSKNLDLRTRSPFIGEFMDTRGSVAFLFDEDVAQLLDRAYEVSIDMDHSDPDPVITRNAASENRSAFLSAVAPYMRLTAQRVLAH